MLCGSELSRLYAWRLRRALLGEHYGEEALMRRFSAELHVREDAPHAFIWHTVEDQAVPWKTA